MSDELNNLVKENGWEIVKTEGQSKLRKVYQFKGFLKTMSFVNAVAWEANSHMHHPDMEISFNKCTINTTTHDDGNTITDKDTKLAMALDKLL
jgi:4a-hydroxytetrahydrobiopterin dehydratase